MEQPFLKFSLKIYKNFSFNKEGATEKIETGTLSMSFFRTTKCYF
jgi:hypothetical protein